MATKLIIHSMTRFLFLDQGEVAEFAPPLELFDREDSIFRGMCNAARLTREQIVKIREAKV
jgi:ATP-binding cassette, subfamily C (CFTR/MRP), member 1